jgi:Ig-like domain CHU_C associated/Secretion system C-terminal sorting domain/SprB repeat
MGNVLKNKILTLLLCALAMGGYAQSIPSVSWAKQQGGTNAEVGAAITTDAAGNVYTTGVFSGTADLDPGTGTFNVTATGAGDVYISKLDANGNFIWGKSIGGTSQENPFGIATDASGNVIVCGAFASTVDFDPGAGTFNLTTAGSTDGFVLKLDASGNFAWAFSLGNTVNEGVYAVTTDAAGNVYAVGNFTGTTDFDPSAGTNDITATGGEDGFVAKYTPAGALTWARKLGTTGADRLVGIDVRANGFVYTAGYISGTMAASEWNTLYPFPIPGAGGNDGVVWQLSASGVPSGGAVINSGGEDQATAVVVDEVNNKVIAAGHYSGTLGMFGNIYSGATDVFLAKWNLDNNNNFTTTRYAYGFGNTLAQLSSSLDIDAAGNVYWGGTTAGVGVDFDPSGNVNQLNSAGANDGFLASYDSTGAMRFAFTIGNSGQDFVGYTLKAQNTNVYVTGGFIGTLDFDPGIGTSNLTPVGSFDAYAVKYNTCVTPAMPTNTTPVPNLTICAGNSVSLSASGLPNGHISWYSASTGGTYLGSGSTFVTPVLSSGTTYYAQDSTCTSSARAAITVNVNQGPTSLSYTASANTVCLGSAVILTGSGAATYAWSGGIFNATPFFPTATTTYTLTGTAANGCSATTTATITVSPRQPITANASATSICLGDSLTLQGSGGQNYYWNNSVTNNVRFAPATAGVFNYIVNGDGLNNCPATPDTVSVTVTSATAPELDILYTPLALTGFSDDIVANGNDYLTSTTTSVDANTDGCRFIDETYTQFGTPTRYLPTGGGFYSEEPTTPNLQFQFASYTANNSLTLQTGNMTGTLTLATPTSMDAFYLLATGGGGTCTLNGVITFTDGTTQAISNLAITDWFNGANAAIKGTGRYYNNALGFQGPADTNPRLYQFLINISAGNKDKYVQSVAFTRTNPGPMKAQLMGMTAVGSASRYCVEDNATVADLYANGSNLQWYAAAVGGAPLATTTALVNGTTYYASQSINGCVSAGRLAVDVIVTTVARTVTHTACGTYTWPENNQTYTSSGTYTRTVVNAFACDSIITLNLTINPQPTVTITATNTAVCEGSSVTLSGNGASTYTWTGGVSDGQSFVPTATATYTVTGTAANGCSATATQTVVVNTPPAANTASTNSSCTAPTGSASVINVVGDGPFSYAWTGSASTTGTASNVNAGVYVCTITDVNGCATPVTVIVNAMNAPTVTLQSQTDVTCFGGSNGAAAVSVTGGSSPYAYAWSSGSSTSNAISNVSAGTYTCTVSDVASCEAFLVVTIAQPAALDSTITVNGMTFTANETTSGVTYQWIDCGNGNAPIVGQTAATFTATQPGNYAVIVTLNSCSVTSDCELTTGVSSVQENTIRLYPNPNNGQFTVASSEDGVLEVFSMTGQLLLHQTISNGETSVSLSGQARGTYLVRVTCGENTTHKRIVIQ